jgi:hypothetical protein
MDHSRDAKSTLTIFLKSTGITKGNMPHGRIRLIKYVSTSKKLTTTPDESSEIQEAYNLDNDSCIGSLVAGNHSRK